jgi:hypothetical protein
MADESSGFRKMRADELTPKKKDELRKSLQVDLTQALIRSIKSEPPELDLSTIKLILKPGQKIADWTVAADCGTCGTCKTCGTCRTGSANTSPRDLPSAVIKKLKLKANNP